MNHLVNRIRIDRVYHARWPTRVSREKARFHKMETLLTTGYESRLPVVSHHRTSHDRGIAGGFLIKYD